MLTGRGDLILVHDSQDTLLLQYCVKVLTCVCHKSLTWWEHKQFFPTIVTAMMLIEVSVNNSAFLWLVTLKTALLEENALRQHILLPNVGAATLYCTMNDTQRPPSPWPSPPWGCCFRDLVPCPAKRPLWCSFQPLFNVGMHGFCLPAIYVSLLLCSQPSDLMFASLLKWLVTVEMTHCCV